MSLKKHVAIIGGGVSGLSLRYFLSKRFPHLKITLFEKEKSLGGCIHSYDEAGFFFEKGARIFKAGKSLDLLKLIGKLGLKKEILISDKRAAHRFIWTNDSFHLLSLRPMNFFSSPLMRTLFFALLKEWKQKKKEGDETIASFAKRRLGEDVTNLFFDPLTLGIYAGDIHKLSILSCYPTLKEFEKQEGSISKGILKKIFFQRKEAFPIQGMKTSSLFTLRKGVNQLISSLAAQGNGEIHLSSSVEKIIHRQKGVDIESQGRKWQVDHLFCALSAQGAKKLMEDFDIETSRFFQHLSPMSLSVIHLGFQKNVLKKRGFGYLIPSLEKEDILGVVFDSETFPEQNKKDPQTRLSVMIKESPFNASFGLSKEKRIELAIQKVRKHLKIDELPCTQRVSDYKKAIPQFFVGHEKRVLFLRSYLNIHYPKLTFLGNYLEGISVSDCISLAEKISTSFALYP